MPWKRTKTILDAGGNSTAETDADVIFTATLAGLAIDHPKLFKRPFHVAMEPEMEVLGQPYAPQHKSSIHFSAEPALGRKGRTFKDVDAMLKHNDVCWRINQLVKSYYKKYEPESATARNLDSDACMTWGFCPSFARGGMIAGGEDAWKLYMTLDNRDMLVAMQYLTAAQAPKGRTDPWEMYIGRGAYCGLVVLPDSKGDGGDAIAAMSTIRTTFRETGDGTHALVTLSEQLGPRWCPPIDHPGYKDKDSADGPEAHRTYVWGMIGNARVQLESQSLGMNMYFGNDNVKGSDIVGYTHGLPRCVYECKRLGVGSPYEMSIGVNTFKLASCMGCTFFMISNGMPPSNSHLGKAESWAPLYHVQGNNPATWLVPNDDAHDQLKTVENCNRDFASKVKEWMLTGLKAMEASPTISASHVTSVKALTKLAATAAGGYDHCALLLDAFTVHAGDADRVIRSLERADSPEDKCDGTFNWRKNAPDWDNTYVAPLTDEQLQALGNLQSLKMKSAGK